MVRTAYNEFDYLFLTDLRNSFSNYGGIPVKAEYCHEAASINRRLVLPSLNAVHCLGTSTCSAFNIHVGLAIRPLYSAVTVSIDRLLCPVVCTHTIRADRGEKGRQVGSLDLLLTISADTAEHRQTLSSHRQRFTITIIGIEFLDYHGFLARHRRSTSVLVVKRSTNSRLEKSSKANRSRVR